MATSTSSSSSSLFSTPFLPSRFFSSSSSPRFFLRFRELPLRGGAPPIYSSFSTSSTSSEFKNQKLSNAHPELHQSLPELDFRGEVSRLRSLLSRIEQVNALEEKVLVLDSDSRVRSLLKGRVSRILSSLELPEAFLVKCMVAAGQGHVLGDNEEVVVESTASGSSLKKTFCMLGDMVEKWSFNENGGGDHGGVGGFGIGGKEELRNLLKTLGQMEEFYDCIGGIIGYQILVSEHLSPLEAETRANWSHLHESAEHQFLELHVPHGHNLVENTEYASQAAMWGIEGLPELGEIYPLGGAGDRLGLVDSKTGDCLPAAMLPYCGRTLLEGLIRDLQAREYLHFKLYGKQSITPVAIMTSSVKNNHKHITALCERLSWFGRGQQNFRLFEQPLVPVVAAEDGQWLITRPLSPLCKPGGHGAIWKLAYDKGIFKWFYSLGRKGATVRQVSNVVAATDLTLLALAGIGLHSQKKLGFASCQRNLGATEGINVLVEKQELDGQWAYGITGIEYTEFDKFGIRDAPIGLGSLQAEFPANTNVLYVDLRSAEKAGSSQNATCLPGMLLNLKKTISYVDHLGIQHSIYGGRLECTMQNIADNFLNTFTSRCNKGIESELDTFVVFNERKRVTSSAKRKRKPTDKSLHQTPDGSLLDVIRNASDILSACNIRIPEIEDNMKYFHSGPPFIILLHPALGPLWEVTRQKFFGGSISAGSELHIEVAEFFWREVQVEGSLSVIAENVMGSTMANGNDEPTLHYGNRCGRCKLQNVKILNKGIDWTSTENVYWKHDLQRFEMLKIVLQGNAEFEATNVVLQGNHVFEVPNGYRMRIIAGDAGFLVKLDPIMEEMMDSGSWFWKYQKKGTHIHLEMAVWLSGDMI